VGRPAKYPEEFRRDAVELVRSSGRPIVDVARSLGITDSTLHNWLKADRDARRRAEDPDALSESEHAELLRLRKENLELRTDKEILRKAAAYFARETMR
jgi:transposase